MEPRSIALTTAVCTLMFSAVLAWHAYMVRERLPGVTTWAWGGAAATAGLALTAGQGWLAPMWSMVTANTLMMASMGLLMRGAGRLHGIAWPGRLWWVLPAAVAGLSVGFTYWWPDPGWRIAVISLMLAAGSGTAVGLFIGLRRPLLRPAIWLISAPLTLLTLLLIARAFEALFVLPPDGLSVLPVNVLTFAVGGACYCACLLGLVLMVQLELAEQLQAQADRDSLTGTLNRRGLVGVLLQLRGPAAVLALDVDHFKRVNDDYGHAMGDSVLALLGRVLHSTLRQTDWVARLGGEEFCAVLPDVAMEGAHVSAERVRLAFYRACQDELDMNVTLSVGVALMANGADFDNGWGAADAALYRAKEGGRNRVVLADGLLTRRPGSTRPAPLEPSL